MSSGPPVVWTSKITRCATPLGVEVAIGGVEVARGSVLVATGSVLVERSPSGVELGVELGVEEEKMFSAPGVGKSDRKKSARGHYFL